MDDHRNAFNDYYRADREQLNKVAYLEEEKKEKISFLQKIKDWLQDFDKPSPPNLKY